MATNILIEIEIDSTTTLRGGVAKMRLSDGTAYHDFKVLELASLKQTVGSLENPRIVPENAQIKLHKQALEDYDLTRKPIKIIGQHSLTATDQTILFEGFVRTPDGIQEDEDTLTVDVESRFSKITSLLTLKKYNSTAGMDFAGKFIPAIFGHFTGQVARLHDNDANAYIVSSLPMRFSADCEVTVYGDGTEINESNYDVDYTNAQIIFNAARSESEITVDGCGVRYGHAQIIKWMLSNILDLDASEIDDDSFDNVGLVPTSRIVVNNNTSILDLISELLFETLHELTFQNNVAALHSRYGEADGEIPESSILRSQNRQLWSETLNTGRLYANHIFTNVNETDYEHNDILEQARVGIVSRNLNLQWYDFNVDDISRRLRAVSENFADKDSSIVSATFDGRAIGATPGSVQTIGGNTYYIISRNLSYKSSFQIALEMWKRPNKALGGHITSVKHNATENDTIEFEWDISSNDAIGAWSFQVTEIDDDDMMGESLSGTPGQKSGSYDIGDGMLSAFELFELSVFYNGIESQKVGFANYDAEVLTASTNLEVVTLEWNVGGDGAGNRTWNMSGQKYRAEYKRSAESWDDAETRDFEGTTTKAWDVDFPSGTFMAGETYNIRIYRVWGAYQGPISNVRNVTPSAGTLTTPTVTVTQDILTVNASWTGDANTTHFEGRWRVNSGAWTDLTDVESPAEIATGVTVGDVYDVEIRALAFGFVTSGYGRGTLTVADATPATPTGLTLRAATQAEYNDQSNFDLVIATGHHDPAQDVVDNPGNYLWYHASWSAAQNATSYAARAVAFIDEITRNAQSIDTTNTEVLVAAQSLRVSEMFVALRFLVKSENTEGESGDAVALASFEGYRP